MSAEEIQSIAADWVNRQRDNAGWSEADQAELDLWLGQAPEHTVAYWRLDAAFERTERLAALRPQPLKRNTARILRNALRFAAVVMLCAGGAGVTYELTKQAPPEQRLYTTEIGARKTIKLADGSQIELNTNSQLRIAPGPRPRMAWLDYGEAYFRIAHDSARPFVVMAKGRRVVDLGTEFLVKAEAKRLEVALVAGRAQIDSPQDPNQEPAVLTPGDVAIATATAISVTPRSTKALADAMSWRQGVLVFKFTTLAAAAAEFNRYNTRKIVIADPAASKLTIVGTFASNDVNAFTDAAQAIFGLKIHHSATSITITR